MPGSFDEEEETTSPEKRAAMYDPARETDPQAVEHANEELARAAYIAKLEAKVEALTLRVKALETVVRTQRQEIRRLRRKS